MSNEESFWIAPADPRGKKPVATGPFDSLEEAKQAGEDLSFAFLVLKTDRGATLDIVETVKAKRHRQMDEATRAANEANRRGRPRPS